MMPALVATMTSSRGTTSASKLAENLLGAAVSVGHGGVDERAAGIAECDELGRSVVGVGLESPGHRAEAEMGHRQPAVADIALLHGLNLAADCARHRRVRRLHLV